MKNMTWNEFKEHIDKLLEKENISKNEEIWYIDISFPRCEEVGKDDDGIDCPSAALDNCGIAIS